ncbi:response regulator transcription factor [Raphidiopsis sp. BLCC-F218]
MALKILVVDDDIGTSLSISDYLELCGYSVLTADDGENALSIIQQEHLDLMVTDIIMPRMNGYELVRRVRQNVEFRLLPVILLTARTKTQERILGYQSGCDLYLPKPFELEELIAAVRNLLERSQIIQSEYCLSSQITGGFPPDDKTRSASIPGTETLNHPDSHILMSISTREREVLELLTHGLSNAEIGSKLYLSPRTVEKYVSSLLRKTSSNNRAELVRFAIKHGIVD